MKRFFLILFLLLLLFTVTVSSHPGRTDSNGGHWNRQEGTYHYHSGEYADRNSSGSSSETADDIEPEVNIVEKETSEEEKEETSEKVIVMKKETPTKEESSTEKENSTGIDAKTIIIIVAIVVGGVVLFLIAKQVIKHYSADEFFGHLFIITIIIAGVIMLQSCDTSETYNKHLEDCDGTCTHIKDYTSEIQEAYRDEYSDEIYEEAYNDIVSAYEDRTYESHVEYCDGTCDHIEDEIEHRVSDLGELCYLESVFDYYDVIKAIENAYIQGYGDCYYGNAQEYSIKEYKNKNVFDE